GFQKHRVVDGRARAGYPDAQTQHRGDRAIAFAFAVFDQVRARAPAAQPRVQLAGWTRPRRVELDHGLVQAVGQKGPDVGARVRRAQPQVGRGEWAGPVEDADLYQVGVGLERDVPLHAGDGHAKDVGADANAVVDGRLGEVGQGGRPGGGVRKLGQCQDS